MRILLLLTCIFVSSELSAQSDTGIIANHLTTLTKTASFRNHRDLETLNKAATYIAAVFRKYADTVYFQEYTVHNKIYKNVIASFATHHKKRIITGAHYDVCGDQQGADDNASGVAGLLEIARLLQGKTLRHRVDLVAYTLEEPPYFETEFMGSAIHAKSLNKQDVIGMVSLEMIGFFKDHKNSQGYPLGFLKLIYGNKGNFITLVKKPGAGKFVRKYKRLFKRSHLVRTKVFTGPRSLPGIDFSDHLNYWDLDIPALMVTDTAFYRNTNYHKSTDTMETLDISRMARVIDAAFFAISGFAM